MQAPVDYPLNDAAHTAEFSVDELTYGVMLDRSDLHDSAIEPVAFAGDHHFTPAPFTPVPIPATTAATSGFRSVPRPLAAIAQTLIADGSGLRRRQSTTMFSRLARTAR